MLQKISMIAAPTGLSPGGYVKAAYAQRNTPNTPVAELAAERSGAIWRVRIAWGCAQPIRELGEDVDRFVDAAAVLAPGVADAPWITMGAPGKPVEGLLWRADRPSLLGVRAEGLGTVERGAAPAGWAVRSDWRNGGWQVELELGEWPVLASQRRLAIAIWQGAQGDRGGLKSVSPGWIEVGA